MLRASRLFYVSTFDAIVVSTTRGSGWAFDEDLPIDESLTVINHPAYVTPTRYRGWY